MNPSEVAVPERVTGFTAVGIGTEGPPAAPRRVNWSTKAAVDALVSGALPSPTRNTASWLGANWATAGPAVANTRASANQRRVRLRTFLSWTGGPGGPV